MIPYIIFILLILIGYFKRMPVWMLAVMIAFAVLRYDTGWDYAMYVDVVDHEARNMTPQNSRFSWFWCYLFNFAHYCNLPHISIIIPNILTYLFIYWGLKLLELGKTAKVQALLVYVCWNTFYLGSFSTIRQSLAMAVAFVVFALIQRRKWIWSVIALAFAVHLHSSAIVAALFYPVWILRDRLNSFWVLIATVGLIIAIESVADFVETMSGAGMYDYSVYLSKSDTYGTKIIIVNLTVAMFLIWGLIKNENSELIRQAVVLAILGFLGQSAIFFLGVSSIISRVFDYFSLFLILALYPVLNTVIHKEKRMYGLLASLLLVAYFFVFLEITQAGGKVASSPFLPYKFIAVE